MEKKLHQNAILTGCLDSFCLICDAHLRNEEEACFHIEKPIHKKNLSSFLHVEKFLDDNIRKLKSGYFCEYCNTILPTLPKIDLHVNDEKHINTKGTHLLQRTGNNIIAYKKVIITESAWNGFIDNICTLCSTEFDNESLHKSTATHSINLIKNNVEFTNEKNIYRKIDDTSFQCLTCNKELAMASLNEHFEDQTHKDLYEKCSNPTVNTTTEVKSPGNQNNITKTFLKDDSDHKKVDSKIKPASRETQIVTTPKTEKDKKVFLEVDKKICSALKAVNYIVHEKNQIICILCKIEIEGKKHIQEHVTSKHHTNILKLHEEQFQQTHEKSPQNDAAAEKAAEIDKSKIVDNVSIYQNNEININFEMRSAYCKKCKKHVAFDYISIEKHMEDHKKVQKKDVIKNSQNTPTSQSNPTLMNKYVKPMVQSSTQVEVSSAVALPTNTPNSSGKPVGCNKLEAEMVAIGKKNEMSYHRTDRRMFCHVCDVNVPANMKNIEQHIKGLNHISCLNLQKQNNNQPKGEPKLNLRRVPMHEFIETITTIQNMFFHECVINDKLCISASSFSFMAPTEDGFKCYVCRCTFPADDRPFHSKTSSHLAAMLEIPVIANIRDEFVREIRPNEYHCGYCNIVQVGYSNMEYHVKTVAHDETKHSANTRLQQYERTERAGRTQLELMMLCRLLSNM